MMPDFPLLAHVDQIHVLTCEAYRGWRHPWYQDDTTIDPWVSDVYVGLR